MRCSFAFNGHRYEKAAKDAANAEQEREGKDMGGKLRTGSPDRFHIFLRDATQVANGKDVPANHNCRKLAIQNCGAFSRPVSAHAVSVCVQIEIEIEREESTTIAITTNVTLMYVQEIKFRES